MAARHRCSCSISSLTTGRTSLWAASAALRPRDAVVQDEVQDEEAVRCRLPGCGQWRRLSVHRVGRGACTSSGSPSPAPAADVAAGFGLRVSTRSTEQSTVKGARGTGTDTTIITAVVQMVPCQGPSVRCGEDGRGAGGEVAAAAHQSRPDFRYRSALERPLKCFSAMPLAEFMRCPRWSV